MSDQPPNPNQSEKLPAEEDVLSSLDDDDVAPSTENSSNIPMASDPETQKRLAELLSKLKLQSLSGSAAAKEHRFWSTQPVPKRG
jgi:hypothetical protein